VHYPSEGEWRAAVPPDALAAMSAQWDEHYTVPVTVTLHPASRAHDHLADEWWDPAIGHMLAWLFRTHAIDVLIVNYTWLSHAFEHCPPGVLRVLDTHDRFSGRREMLALAGIEPEFFHTTEAEERRALARAHVVWSIKPQEAAFFISLGIAHVVNMPFCEPMLERNVSTPRPEILRFGLVGAANSINLVNTRAFLAAVRAYVARTLLPCEIVIAGSICDLLDPPGVGWIRLLGRLPDLARFYDAVDVVVAPIAHSTGLKIKVGEALCQGKAVMALGHAFEGYPARHPFHTLASLDDMMTAMRDVVNAPDLITELERLSGLVVRDVEAEIQAGLQRTIAELSRVPFGVCVVIPLDELFEGSMVLDHALEAAAYLGPLAEVSVFVDGNANAAWDTAKLHLLGGFACLILPPHPDQAATDRRLRGQRHGRVCRLGLAALVRLPHMALWFASTAHSWEAPASASPTRAYLNLDLAILGESRLGAPRMLDLLAASFEEVVTLSRRGLEAAFHPAHAAWTHRVPCFWRGERSLALARLRDLPRESITILTDSADDPLLALTLSVVSRLSPRRIEVVLPGRCPPRGEEVDALPGAAWLGVRDCFAAQGVRPSLVIDISRDPRMECAREVFDRSELPCVTLFGDFADSPRGASPASRAAGLFASMELLASVLYSADLSAAMVEERAHAGIYRNDAGWASIWIEMKRLAKSD